MTQVLILSFVLLLIGTLELKEMQQMFEQFGFDIDYEDLKSLFTF